MKCRHSTPRIVAGPAFALALLTLATGSHAAVRFKVDNADNLNLASSWDTLPGTVDIAQWDFTVTAANSATLGADLGWAGIKITDPGGPVTLGGGHTLTIGTAGIDLGAATQDLTISSGLTVFGKQSWKAAVGRALDVAGTFARSGATVDFTNFDATATLGTLANDASGILGPWATTGSTTSLQYVSSTGGLIAPYADATAATADLSDITSPTTNYTYGAAATLAGNQSGNTLRYSGGATTTALGTNGLTLNGLMSAGSGALTLTSTAGNPGLIIGASGELDIISNAQALNISARITETGAGKVIYNAAGQITLAASASANAYSGGTVINSAAGTNGLTAVGVGTWFGSGPVTVNGGFIFFSNNTLANDFTFNGGLATMNNSSPTTLNGTITLAVPTTFQLNTNGNMVINGKVTGPGGLTKTQGTNHGSLQLASANNDYSGLTTVTGGVLQVKSSLYGNDTAKWTPANISVASGATFAVNTGGASDFSISDVGTMLTNLLISVDNNGLKAGSFFGLSTANATGTVTFATTVTDSAGTGGGAVGLRKLGAGTLELTGANTYSGKTMINLGALKVSSLNSVASPAASSSLGRPTTAANGTIEFSAPTSTTGNATCSLIYIGTTDETTDRVLKLPNQLLGGILDQSGTGLLKFASDLVVGSGDATKDQRKTLTLQGSTAGTGEIAGVIPNSAVGVAGQLATSIAKVGTGTWVLSGANTYTGTTTVSGGTLLVNNTTGSGTGTGNVNINAGALGGDGFITGAVTIGNNAGSDDAILAPGNSVGSIDTGNLTFNSDGSYACEVGGTLVTSDQTNVTGTVTIKTGAVLTVSLTGSPAVGQKYFIVTNNMADAIIGTFDGLAQDAVVGSYGGTDLKISYTGDFGTSAITGGNDIVLYTVASGNPYDTWAAGTFTNPFTNTLPGVDFDNDGLSNLLEFVLGGDPTISQAGIAPTMNVSGGNLVLTFKRSDASEPAPAVTLKVELSADLSFSTPAEDITVGPVTDPGPIAPTGASYTVSNSGGFDTITVTIPQGAVPRAFARVKAIQTP